MKYKLESIIYNTLEYSTKGSLWPLMRVKFHSHTEIAFILNKTYNVITNYQSQLKMHYSIVHAIRLT